MNSQPVLNPLSYPFGVMDLATIGPGMLFWMELDKEQVLTLRLANKQGREEYVNVVHFPEGMPPKVSEYAPHLPQHFLTLGKVAWRVSATSIGYSPGSIYEPGMLYIASGGKPYLCAQSLGDYALVNLREHSLSYQVVPRLRMHTWAVGVESEPGTFIPLRQQSAPEATGSKHA